jgi:hypothetical protein
MPNLKQWKALDERTKTLKARIYISLGVLFVFYYCYSISDLGPLIRVTAVAAGIAILIVLLMVKFRLVYKNYPKGIGAIALAFVLLFWKTIHAYSVKLEMTIALTVSILTLTLTFKYSWSELTTGKERKESTKIGAHDK